eukprot:GHVP01021132.1.p1 GENE.GHVP01021132.1~~GHVP01021132.1.p1  ORF type:complete len:450 (+),score=65.19 GHVP01021132.1:2434-3783(+)
MNIYSDEDVIRTSLKLILKELKNHPEKCSKGLYQECRRNVELFCRMDPVGTTMFFGYNPSNIIKLIDHLANEDIQEAFSELITTFVCTDKESFTKLSYYGMGYLLLEELASSSISGEYIVYILTCIQDVEQEKTLVDIISDFVSEMSIDLLFTLLTNIDRVFCSILPYKRLIDLSLCVLRSSLRFYSRNTMAIMLLENGDKIIHFFFYLIENHHIPKFLILKIVDFISILPMFGSRVQTLLINTQCLEKLMDLFFTLDKCNILHCRCLYFFKGIFEIENERIIDVSCGILILKIQRYLPNRFTNKPYSTHLQSIIHMYEVYFHDNEYSNNKMADFLVSYNGNDDSFPSKLGDYNSSDPEMESSSTRNGKVNVPVSVEIIGIQSEFTSDHYYNIESEVRYGISHIKYDEREVIEFPNLNDSEEDSFFMITEKININIDVEFGDGSEDDVS